MKSFCIILRLRILAALARRRTGSTTEASDPSDGLTRTMSDRPTTTATNDFTPAAPRTVLNGTFPSGPLGLAAGNVTLLETRTLTERK